MAAPLTCSAVTSLPPPGSPGTASHLADARSGAASLLLPVQRSLDGGMLPFQGTALQIPNPYAGAKQLVAWGARIFDLDPGSKSAAGTNFTLEHATTRDPRVLSRIWGNPASLGGNPYGNVAWRTGRVPGAGEGPLGGVVLLDLDVRGGKKGPATLLRCAAEAGLPLAGASSGAELQALQALAHHTRAMLIQTCSGGFHIIWCGSGRPEFGASNKKWLERFGPDCGIDVRARNGYAVGPGSWGLRDDWSWGQYKVLHVPADVLEAQPARLGDLPDWVAGLLEVYVAPAPLTPGAAGAAGGGSLNGSTAVALERLQGALSAIDPDGSRWLSVTMAIKHAVDFEGYPPYETQALWDRWCQGALWAGGLSRKYFPVMNLKRWDSIGRAEGTDLGHVFRLAMNARGQLTATQAAAVAEGAGGGIAGAVAEGAGGGIAGADTDVSVPVGTAGVPVGTAGVPVGTVGAGAPPPLKLSSAAIEDEDNPTWVIENALVAGSLNVLLGEGASGKSQLTIAIAAAISRGVPLGAACRDLQGQAGAIALMGTPFGRIGNAGHPGNVMMIADEDHWSKTIKPRLHAAGADRDRVMRVDGANRFDKATGKWETHALALDVDTGRIRATLQAQPADSRFALIVIDPLNAYFGAKADSYKAADVRRVLTPLAKLAEDMDVPVLGIMHPNKKNEGDVVHWINGAAATGQLARTVWAVLPDPDDGAWQAEGRLNRRQIWCHAKGNLGASRPLGAVLEVVSHSYTRGTSFSAVPKVIETARVEFRGTTPMVANEVARRNKEALQEERGSPKAGRPEATGGLVREAILDVLASADGNELPVGVVQRLIQEQNLGSRATFFRVEAQLLEDGSIVRALRPDATMVLRLTRVAKAGVP
jgi:AAA domain/Bifunctional DNA primase/polymerase, N-terminal